MDTDLSNPAATAYFYTVEDAAVEMTVQPQAVFADMTIQGTVSGLGPASPIAPAENGNGSASASAGAGIDPKWIMLLALAVIVIGAVALVNER